MKISKEFEDGKEEWWGMVYKCPNCDDDRIWHKFLFCPSCGIKLEWDKNIDGENY